MVTNETLRISATLVSWCQRHHQPAVLQPRQPMTAHIELINDWHQRFLTAERVQVHDDCLWRHIQLSRAVEKQPPQCPHVAASEVPSQLLRQIGAGIVYQGHQPTEQLQWPAMKPWPLPVGTLLVVA